MPVDFTKPHLEGGRLIGYGIDRVYSINYQDVNKGGQPEILDFLSDNMTDCVTVSGSADAFCGGKFVKAGIQADLPSEKTAIIDGATLHLYDGVLTALASEYSFSKELEMNYQGVEACEVEGRLCFIDLDGNSYCVSEDGVASAYEETLSDCSENAFSDGQLVLDGKSFPFAEQVNQSSTHKMWKRELADNIYYFFTKAESEE